MALDQVEVMKALGFEKFYAVGHDRGARVLHRMMIDNQNSVKKAVFMEETDMKNIYQTKKVDIPKPLKFFVILDS